MTGLVDAAGIKLVHHPKELDALNQAPKQQEHASIKLRVASFGSWPALVDWDADGDLDLLIGTFRGEMFLRLNVGTRTKPAWAPESVPFEADGAAFKVNGHAAPVVADWDGDGLWDLVLGVSDGAVVWLRNAGDAKRPVFGAPQTLVAAKAGLKLLRQHLAPKESPAPGVRAQVCVTDYDGDGRLDLVVGDWSQIVAMRKLTAKERETFDGLLKEEEAVAVELGKVTGDAPEDDKLAAAYDAIGKKKELYYADPKAKPVTSSFIWLYRRVAEK